MPKLAGQLESRGESALRSQLWREIQDLAESADCSTESLVLAVVLVVCWRYAGAPIGVFTADGYVDWEPSASGDLAFELRNAPLRNSPRPDRLSLHVDGLGELDAQLVTQAGREGASLRIAGPPGARDLLAPIRVALRGLLDAPESALSALPLLAASDEERVVEEWNDTARETDTSRLLHELFEDRARAAPDAIALVVGDAELRYGELDAWANRVACDLVERGLEEGAFVGVCLERSFELIVAVLAILKAGAAYVPIEPGLPQARRDFVLQDCGARHVLVAASGAGFATEADVDCVPMPSRATSRDAVRVEGRRPGPDAPAYAIYTSGTTGQPKGVLVTHRPVLSLIQWLNPRFEVTAADRVLAVASIGFDLSVYDIFGILGAGGSICLATSEELAEPRRLATRVATSGATIWNSAPAALSVVLPFLRQLEDPGRLRLALLSGDWIPLSMPDDLRALHPEVCFVALGGATEATVWSNYCVVDRIDPDWASIPYGRPIDNAEYFVLDAALRPQPPGFPGDLYIGGECLALGYLNRPELTSAAFFEWQARAGSSRRIYRTGDRARFFASGDIEFLGRRDHQVKVRGYRIELGEIDTSLEKLPGVDRAATIVLDDADLGRSLVTFYTAHDVREGLDPAKLVAGLAETLPEYMLPREILPLAQLPLTENGKLDRKRLVQIAAQRVRPGYQAPESRPESPAPVPESWGMRWQPLEDGGGGDLRGARVLLLADEGPFLEFFEARLRALGAEVVSVVAGDTFQERGPDRFSCQIEQSQVHLTRCFETLGSRGWQPTRILHLWALSGTERMRPGLVESQHNRDRGHGSVRGLQVALRRVGLGDELRPLLLTSRAFGAEAREMPDPDRALLLAIALETTTPMCACDVDWPDLEAARLAEADWLLDFLAREERPRLSKRRKGQTLEGVECRLPELERSTPALTTSREPRRTLFLGAGALPGQRLLAWMLQSTDREFVVPVSRQVSASVEELLRENGWADRCHCYLAEGAAESAIQGNAAWWGLDMDGIDSVVMSAFSPAVWGPLAKCRPSCSVGLGYVNTIQELDHIARQLGWCEGVVFTAGSALSVLPGCEASVAAWLYADALGRRKNAMQWQAIALPLLGAFDESEAEAPRLSRDLDFVFEHDWGPAEFASELWAKLPARSAGQHICSLAPSVLEEWLTRRQEDRGRYCDPTAELSAVEEQMLDLMRMLLGQSELTLEDDFFDMGGHSLLAVEVLAEIERLHHVELPLAALLEAPSARSLAARVEGVIRDRDAGASALRYVVPLKKDDSSSDVPLWLVAGGMGNVLNLRPLAHELNRTVFGLQARGLLDDDLPHETLEECARDYVRELRQVQPEGPYLMGGFSSGGLIAIEMARVLHAQGEEIRPLVLLDAWLLPKRDPCDALEKLRWHLRGVRRGGPGYLWKLGLSFLDWRKRERTARQRQLRESMASGMFRSVTVLRATERAIDRYEPGPLDVPAWLFRPPLDCFHRTRQGSWLNAERREVEPQNGLAGVLPRLEVIELHCNAGDHDGFVLEPHVRELAIDLERLWRESGLVRSK